MEVTTRTVSRNRCSCCRQEGHNRTRCPHDAAEATSLREAYNRERRERNRALVERAMRPGSNASLHDQVADMQRRLRALTNESGSVAPTASPTVREVKIQEILFDHCQEIPDGLYKQLMDALVLRG
tara:strand:- start:1395 stop:1772 length:378 start_codon:yes stop_codon:yes gene_type:complete